MLYPIDAYDKHGLLKPSAMLWLTLIFNAKAWIIFVMAGASREQGAQVLEILYPVRNNLYFAMVMGLPALFLMWVTGQRHKNKKLINALWRRGKSILLAAYMTDCALQVYQLTLLNGAFSWSRAITLLITVWLGLYLIRSTRVRNTFADQPLER
ncbi:membrane protein [Photobacterium marinum]|uniref:Membrane protein n=1 Tax=Photobacterium marinum TaxID=1056511 RepID=L8JAA9_9GAMM|nr:DUF2919 domain-containing protein [Photobacterium marinum]ELR65158.1 membrane protein [Photobacterium marinum]